MAGSEPETRGASTADGYLFLTGRLKEIINRGGEKIAPKEVDEVLRSTRPSLRPWPLPCRIRRSARTLPRLCLEAGCSHRERDRRDSPPRGLRTSRFQDELLIVDEIPKGPTGKLQRIGLADKLADQLARKGRPSSSHRKRSSRSNWAKSGGRC